MPPARDTADELDRARRELAVAHREAADLAFAIGHDLRAPLRSVDGFSQALEEEYADRLDENAREYLTHVREATARLSRQIDDITTMMRVSSAPLLRETLDLSAMALRITESLKHRHAMRVVHTTIAPGLTLVGDPKGMERALSALLENAWKYSASRADAHVEVGHVVSEGEESFFVRDDGVGFDMAHAKRLFGLFRKLDARDEVGTGASLAIAHRIIERHGGKLWAEATVEAGATFRFTVPPESDG